MSAVHRPSVTSRSLQRAASVALTGLAVFDSHFVTWVVLADSRPSERQNFRRPAAPVALWPGNALAGETDLQLLAEYVIHCLSRRSLVQEAMQP